MSVFPESVKMLQLLTGLVLFLGIHSIAIVALPLRDRMAARSEVGWKAFYGVVSLAGLVLIVRGYADLRMAPELLYAPPLALRHLAALLLLPVFVLFLAPYFPGRIKAVTRHPQLIAVILWSGAHLLVNGMLADVILFGSFLVWAILDLASMRSRPARPVPGAPPAAFNDVILLVLGLGLYIAFAAWLHRLLFGVAPFG